MRLFQKFFTLPVIFLFLFFPSSQTFAQNDDSLVLRKLYDHCLTKSRCYESLRHLTQKIGGRLSGSAQAEQAVIWAKKAMYEAGADTVLLQPCMVPHWVRGSKEKCSIRSASTSEQQLACISLGSSIGTGKKGLLANVIEVSSFDDLHKLGEKGVKGKIVFFNVFFDQRHVRPGNAYGETVKYRGRGASNAAKYGAIACLVRSMTSLADDEPHTGNMGYDTSVSKIRIPAMALGYRSADLLHETLLKDPKIEVYFENHCENLDPVPSFNVVGQVNGSLKNNEFIIAGGHLDSWDNGQGAHDDGAGIVQTMEILGALKAVGIKPRHNIRAVAFMNEENGLGGGAAYAAWAKNNNEKHLAAIEADAGGFSPRSFGVDTLNGLFNLAFQWKNLFAPYLIERITPGGGGADLIDLEKLGVPCIGYEPDTQRYFDIHHTAQDTFDKINKRELELGAGALGALVYLMDKYH
jgi:carboxypeptidase Q